MKKSILSVAWVILTLQCVGTVWASSDAALKTVLADPLNQQLFQAYLATLPKVGERYVLEGDILLSADEVHKQIVVLSAGPQAPAGNTELLITRHNGAPGLWAKEQRQLSYAVDRGSFPTPETYQNIVDRMKAATQKWSEACPKCDLTFTHKAQHDGAPSHDDVTFIVRSFDAGGAFIASAFFPFTAPEERFIEIDPSFFSAGLSFDKTGVLRHELGHVIGYRHEHIRSGLPGCFVEDNEWTALTEYDSQSVMHYLCGGAGNPKLDISDRDKVGHKSIYGSP